MQSFLTSIAPTQARPFDTSVDTGFIDTLAVAMIPIMLYFVFIFAPIERSMGLAQKIFYFHVSAAWVGFFALFVTFVFSIISIANKSTPADNIAYTSAKVGFIFCTIVLLTGAVWGRLAWGVWWSWDARLTTMFALWFMYAGYLASRDVISRGKSAALAIVSFFNVPIVFFSIRLWERGIHPNVLGQGGGGIHPDMMTALMVSLFAFTCVYLAVIRRMMRAQL